MKRGEIGYAEERAPPLILYGRGALRGLVPARPPFTHSSPSSPTSPGLRHLRFQPRSSARPGGRKLQYFFYKYVIALFPIYGILTFQNRG